MDTTRISIAQLLALDVPLTWQDAVAVAQEAAMLSDVHAAMNTRPSLVSPETCFISRTGDLELPETTEVESPDAVTLLLREMLAGRDAPEDLEAIAFGHATRDMSGALQRFPVPNRRAEIAKLATRALALRARPLEVTTVAPAAAPVPHPAPQLVAPPPRTSAPARPPVAATAASTAFVREAPFRASRVPPPGAVPPAPAIGVSTAAPDAELRRLRRKTVERERARRRLTQRFRAAFVRLGDWVTWRPSSPDPRVLGGAVVVTAAVVSILWNNDRPSASPTGGSSVATPAADRAAVWSPAPALPAGPAPPAPAATAGAASPAATPPLRASAVRRGDAVPAAAPEASRLPESAAVAERAAPPAPKPRSGITVTLPALDPPPGPLTADSGAEPSPIAPRSSTSGRGREGANAIYSAGDDEVAPPVLLRQQLPSQVFEPTADAPADWPFLELLIDHRGAVEQVRLHAKAPAPGQTLYRHRMLLAAAKAWQFEPARRQGVTVRYVMRVPLEP